jgi:hypothetical protein
MKELHKALSEQEKGIIATLKTNNQWENEKEASKKEIEKLRTYKNTHNRVQDLIGMGNIPREGT